MSVNKPRPNTADELPKDLGRDLKKSIAESTTGNVKLPIIDDNVKPSFPDCDGCSCKCSPPCGCQCCCEVEDDRRE